MFSIPSTIPNLSHVQPSPPPTHASHQNPAMVVAPSSYPQMSSSPSPSSLAQTLASAGSSRLDHRLRTKDTDGHMWIRPGPNNT